MDTYTRRISESNHGFTTIVDTIPKGTFRISLFGCKGLKAMDISGSSDPYVIVTCDNNNDGKPLTFKTKTILESTNPVFNEVISVPWSGMAKLTFAVFDYDIVT
jgi:Ca2+-dependent lipid-binding protein